VKKWMDEEKQFPFKFESIEPPAVLPSFDGEYQSMDCKVGGVVILDRRFFQVIE
jgi:hypothetical protein